MQRALAEAVIFAVAVGWTAGCSTSSGPGKSDAHDGGRQDAIAGHREAGSASSSAPAGLQDAGRDGSVASSSTGSGSSRGSDAGTGSGSGGGSDASAGSGEDSGRDGGQASAVDTGPPRPNCASGDAGVTSCGTDRESCCTSPEVEGGTYDRTYDLSDAGLPVVPLDGGPTNEADPATVSGFRLDRYLVTVGRFRQFVRAWTAASSVDGGVASMLPAGSGKHTHLNGGRGLAVAPSTDAGQTYEPGWDPSDDGNVAPTTANLACDLAYATWTPSPGNREGLPINCVNWYESYAFCIWDGGFLPSEAEWEYAAAGGSEQRVYPWGTTPPGTDSDYAIYGCDYPLGPGHCESSVADIAPVGTAADGAGRWGQLDLAGELFEWNLDGYSTPYDDPCTDCAFLTSTSTRVIRGGYFLDTSTVLIVSARAGDRPSIRSEGFGFRCARAP